MNMSGDKLRASGWAPIKSDAANVEVVEAVNGLGWRVEGLADRFDTFHSELSLMRGMLGDLVPRVTSVEKVTLGAKAKGGALVAGKYSLVVVVVTVLGRAAAKQWPQLGEIINGLLGALAGLG